MAKTLDGRLTGYEDGVRLVFATSCLSHLPLRAACEALGALGRRAVEEGRITAWGLQLCPGHLGPAADDAGPQPGPGPAVARWTARPAESLPATYAAVEAAAGGDLTLHDGFAWDAPRQPVWEATGALAALPSLGLTRTIHPPGAGAPARWVEEIEAAEERGDLAGVEVMYGPHAIRDCASLPSLPLVVDVSHLNLWADPRAGLVAVDRHRVVEVHISDNDGRGDQHRPLRHESFGLRWAADRARSGVPLVLECRMRYLDRDARLEQVSRAVGGVV